MQFFGGTVTSQQLEQIDSRKLRGQRILSRLFVNQDNPNDELFDEVKIFTELVDFFIKNFDM